MLLKIYKTRNNFNKVLIFKYFTLLCYLVFSAILLELGIKLLVKSLIIYSVFLFNLYFNNSILYYILTR